MRRLVEFPLESGGIAVVEVDDDGSRPVTRGGLRAEAVPERAQLTFEQAVSRVQPAADALVSRLRAMTQAPDEVTVGFGLQLSAEAGAFIASASSTAHFTVTLTWRARSSPGGDPAGDG
jgi:hypothetical protein